MFVYGTGTPLPPTPAVVIVLPHSFQLPIMLSDKQGAKTTIFFRADFGMSRPGDRTHDLPQTDKRSSGVGAQSEVFAKGGVIEI